MHLALLRFCGAAWFEVRRIHGDGNVRVGAEPVALLSSVFSGPSSVSVVLVPVPVLLSFPPESLLCETCAHGEPWRVWAGSPTLCVWAEPLPGVAAPRRRPLLLGFSGLAGPGCFPLT